jgi:hypothetical protein
MKRLAASEDGSVLSAPSDQRRWKVVRTRTNGTAWTAQTHSPESKAAASSTAGLESMCSGAARPWSRATAAKTLYGRLDRDEMYDYDILYGAKSATPGW